MERPRSKLSKLFAFIFFVLLLTGCASKKTRTVAPPLMDPKPSEQVSRPIPVDPIQLPPPPDSTPIVEDPVNEDSAPSGVVIVAGGAGVASFGLIGVLQRFQVERIKVDAVITTGWPSLVGLGFGLLRSIHDVEWMASRLTEKDLEGLGGFTSEQKLLDAPRFSKLMESNFGNREINQSRIPIAIAAVNTDLGKPDVYDRGDWRYPLGKTFSIPGIYRPAVDFDLREVQAVDMREALRRSRVVILLNFYEDFWSAVEQSKRKLSSTASMKAYVKRLKEDFSEEAKEATLVGKVTLGKDFDDLSLRRLAIVLGQKEGQRLAKEIRALRR